MRNKYITKKAKQIQGFTLIELLVVIAIIGVLASFLLVNFIGIRQRGRDTRRKSDIRQIQAALELYRSDNGIYPSSTNDVLTAQCGSGNSFSFGGVTYLQTVPCDPLGSTYWNGGQYSYESPSGNATYMVGACLENTNDSEAVSQNPTNQAQYGGNNVAGCSGGKYYAVTNP